jgi:hypothetical protein
MKNFFVCLALIGISSTASAIECGNAAFNTAKTVSFPGSGYWMQAAGDCRVTHTSVGGTNSQLYNYCTNRAENITTRADAFPVPGFEQLYVHPTADFFKIGGNGQSIYEDNTHTGVYQSLGLVEGGGNSGTVRILAGWGGGVYRDYRIVRNGENYNITPVGERVTTCQNLGGIRGDLPIISRNGRMVSGRSTSSQGQVIYEIQQGGSCRVIREIPRATSKISYTFDNKYALYVVQDPNTNKGRLISMDIASGVEKTLSAPTEDVQYVSAKADGSIIYSRRGQNGNELAFIRGGMATPSGQSQQQQALGLVWATKCNVDVDADSAEAVGRRLSGNVCNAITQETEVRQALADSPYASIQPASIRSLCSSNGNGAQGSGTQN